MKVIQSENICSTFNDYDGGYDGEPSLKFILEGIKSRADQLKQVYEYHWKGREKDILDLNTLVNHLNWAYPTEMSCSFCKAKQNNHKIIIYTSDEKALKWLKSKIVDEQYQWDSKTRTVDGEIIQYWIIAFKYVNLLEFLGESLIKSIKDDYDWITELWEKSLYSEYEED